MRELRARACQGDARWSGLLGLLGLVLLASAAAPQAARACGACLVSAGFEDGQPADGATGVPRNVAPWFRGAANEIALLDPDGDPVPALVGRHSAVSTDSCGGRAYGEIRPQALLEPHTTYTIRLSGPIGTDAERSFTTGDAVLEARELPVPKLRIAYERGSPRWDCAPTSRFQGCVAAEGEQDAVLVLQATHVEPDHTWSPYMLLRATDAQWFFTRAAPEDLCFTARYRDLAGRLGDTVTTCLPPSPDAGVPATADAGTERFAEGTCSRDDDWFRAPPASQLDTDAAAAGPDAQGPPSGCSAAPGPAPAPPWLAALAVLTAARSRRRRARG